MADPLDLHLAARLAPLAGLLKAVAAGEGLGGVQVDAAQIDVARLMREAVEQRAARRGEENPIRLALHAGAQFVVLKFAQLHRHTPLSAKNRRS
ncbi:hypothetical protein D3C78_1707290 [compost metagenome]